MPTDKSTQWEPSRLAGYETRLNADGHRETRQIVPLRDCPHEYTSTACHHGLHEQCRQRCKFCDTPCRCECHKEPTHAS